MVHDTDVGYKNYVMKYDFWIEKYKIGPIQQLNKFFKNLILMSWQTNQHLQLEGKSREAPKNWILVKKSNSGYGQIHKDKHINQKESKIFLNCTKL